MKKLALALCLVAAPAFANVGTVVDTEGNSKIITNDVSRNATVGSVLVEGDVLKTRGSGTIHIEMRDGTKFLVGPSTEISIDVANIGGNSNRFKELGVGITAGTFRFLSGNSPSDAYEVTTPSSTMGIRGTVFDVVTTRQRDRYVVFEGSVRLCPGSNTTQGACSILPDSCVVASVDREIVEARSDQAREIASFPLLRDQDRYLPDYRADTGNCSEMVVRDRTRDPEEVRTTSIPTDPESPETPDRPDRPDTPDRPDRPDPEPKSKSNASENNNKGGNNGKGGKERDGSKNPRGEKENRGKGLGRENAPGQQKK